MITTIIFDYGNVLAYPKSGNWFITNKTLKIIGLFNYLKILSKKGKLKNAFNKAYEYLNKNHKLYTENEEFYQFVQFYKIILKEFNVIKNYEIICKKLSEEIVYNDNKVIFYNDVINKLTELKQKYKIIIISDTWPSLKRILKNQGIFPLLDGLIMSCNYGETKETTKLFEIAISKLKLIPKECVFIDDSISNLITSEKVGFIPILMDRKNRIKQSVYPIINDINGIHKFLVAN